MTQALLCQSSPRPTVQEHPEPLARPRPRVASAPYRPSTSSQLAPVPSSPPSPSSTSAPHRAHAPPPPPRPSTACTQAGLSRHPPSDCRDIAIKAHCLARACPADGFRAAVAGKRSCMCRFSWRERRRRGLCDRLGNEHSRCCGSEALAERLRAAEALPCRKGAGPSGSTPAHMGGLLWRPRDLPGASAFLPVLFPVLARFHLPSLWHSHPCPWLGLFGYFAVAAPCTSSDSPLSCQDVCSP